MRRGETGSIIAYHRCDRETVAEPVFAGKAELVPSNNPYDWLGAGIYFWERDYHRARDWAQRRAARNAPGSRPMVTPYDVGALIDPRHCLDLVTYRPVQLLQEAHEQMGAAFKSQGRELPTNRGEDIAPIRELDCAVIQFLHAG